MSDGQIPENDRQRHRHVRAGFVALGTSLNAWCRENGVTLQSADKALNGEWTGPGAEALVRRIMRAAENQLEC
jgi:hypothetical protein